MTLTELQKKCAVHPSAQALSLLLKRDDLKTVFCGGLHASASAFVFASQVSTHDSPLIFILDDIEQAGYFYHDLVQMCGTEHVLFFPSSFRRAAKYGQKDAANEILRTEVLSRLQKKEDGLCIVTYPEALAEKVVSHEELDTRTLKLAVNHRVDTSFVIEMLGTYGFEHTDYVYEPGQYAVRGSIIDVFSFASEYPYRIDFFGDEVESIRTFEVETQLSTGKKEEITIVPDLMSRDAERISFLRFLPADSTIAVRDLTQLRERVDSVCSEALSSQALIAGQAEGVELPRLHEMFADGPDFLSRILDFRRIEFGNKPSTTPDARIDFDTAAQPIYHKNFDLAAQSFKRFIDDGYTIYICSDSSKQTDRIRDIFLSRGDDISFTPVERTLHEGFADHALKLCVFTDHQLFDRFHKYNLKSEKARSGKVALSLKELNQFMPGDYVVHTDHGIGRFDGLIRLPNGDSTQEVIKLVYQNEDVVFVSIHSLHKVSKYKGREGEPPRLNKLGSGAWEKLKERTKTKIKDIARDLIRLYARRREEKGFAFSKDSFLQRELEASFVYEDTPDQMKATAAVKADMENAQPMDRLICGDVGFGKTEVAIRAAFKAVADGKQVAVLVPTTVLAYQHFQTFRDRLKPFPCTIDYLSRARTATQIKTVVKDVAEGRTDILIGTHRLLGKDVRFKDLGLLIIDEEQKFGVSVKEKLRQMKVNVDTLTLTATPIPRTLQFSLMGARDLSVISTPPPNRYPIQTEVHTFDEDLIAEAIRFEMSRNGQVFFVNNRIANLQALRAMILRHIPDCRVAIGHGQMPPDELEQTVLDFVNYDYDVLLTTTIIESGIDIPNANTIIINGAQNFGLSDLHQMRGRVGRSNRKAFCYLLAPALGSLTTEGRRRLQAIENFSDLGSGIHIAMQDLDIRGAGNLLGAEQSGFITDLGYETYQKILSEAVKELRDDEFPGLLPDSSPADAGRNELRFVDDCQVESDLELLLPDSYVSGSSERMSLYRELDSIDSEEEVRAFRLRLEDRFGHIPRETEELLRIVSLRRLAAGLGTEKIFLKGGRMTLFFVSNPHSPFYQSDTFGKIIGYMMRQPKNCDLREQNNRRSLLVKHVPNVETAVNILKEITAMPVNEETQKQ